MKYKKINKEEFEKLQELFPNNQEMWQKYKNKRLKQFDNKEIEVFVIENDNKFIGEITVNYINHDLQTETIPNKRVYLEAFRVDKKYRGHGLGQQLINFVIGYLIEKDYTEFTIGVEEDNEIAKHIYFKLGFTEAIDKGYGDEFDSSDYTLYLKNIEIDKIIENLIKNCNLGNIKELPKRVSGGLLNRMYKVITDAGIYAVKMLNPEVMKRKNAMSRHIFAEKVTNLAKQNGVNSLPAIIIKGRTIQEVNGYYFLIFNWVEGKAINDEELDFEKCQKVAKELAKLHKIDFGNLKNETKSYYDKIEIDWDFYIERLSNKTLKELLNKNKKRFKELDKNSMEALQIIENRTVISHSDLDLPNILWVNNEPLIIDWESVGLINPSMELIDAAWNWSGGQKYFDIEKFKMFVKTYKENGGDIRDFEKALEANFKAKFGWLEYNLKRVCKIECIDEEERILGEKEVVRSIDEINKFDYYSVHMKDSINM